MGDLNNIEGEGSTNKEVGPFGLGKRNEETRCYQFLQVTRSGSGEYLV